MGSLEVFKEREEISRKTFEQYKDKIFEILGENEKLQLKIREYVEKFQKELYEKLYKEIKEEYKIDVKTYKINLGEDVKEALNLVFPQYKQLLEDFEREEHPLTRLEIIKMFETIKTIFTLPVKELSGKSFDIPSELSEEIYKRTGIFIGYGMFSTPKNNIPYTLTEIIRQGMKFYLPHPIFRENKNDDKVFI